MAKSSGSDDKTTEEIAATEGDICKEVGMFTDKKMTLAIRDDCHSVFYPLGF